MANEDAPPREEQPALKDRPEVAALVRKPDEVELAPPVRTVLEQRIDVIVGLMRHGKWIRGRSDDELAAAWNIDPSAVRRYAAEANRTIRRILEETEDGKAELVKDIRRFMREIAEEARAMASPQGHRVAADAMDRYAAYLGVLPAVQVQQVRDMFADWTDEQLQEFLATGKRPDKAP